MLKKMTWLHFFLCLILAASPLLSQNRITTPKEHFGFNIGDDYCLATYSQLVAYWNKLEQESDRMILKEIGKTAENRMMIMAIITSPENHADLEHYQDIAQRMAHAEDLDDEEAHRLAAEGKAVIWIDGGLHATEVVGAQQEIELVYQMVSRSDPETLRILDNVILLATITNPDGMDMVGEWYMAPSDPAERTTSGLPRLYHKYVGHDNNRDFYMINMPETEAVCNVLYREWFPQVVYNHHQTGPAGTVLFAPPFRNPFNYNYDPLLPLGIEVVGSAMHTRFAAEGKPGATMRSGASYQTWWNGGLRTTPYFHNMIGILTEIIGNPTPQAIPFIPKKHLPNNDYPYPIAPQKWHMRQSIEYSITADRAILDTAAKLKENFLYNLYRMGKNSILRGSRDHWTMNPSRLAGAEDAIKKDNAQPVGTSRWSRGYEQKYYDGMFDPATRDPRGYILSANQNDFLTATKFINILIKGGVTVHRATRSFSVDDKKYPAGSYVVKTAQAFRPHVRDMFEPQIYPDDIPYPGGPPRPPYDSAGYTLAFQMGVEFDRILDGFDGPFEKLEDPIKPPEGKLTSSKASGYCLDPGVNDAFIAVNRLLKSGEKVIRLQDSLSTGKASIPAGAFYIPAKTSTIPRLQSLAREIGLTFQAVDTPPRGDAPPIKPVRIGLWDQYGGNSASGWVRWLLEQFEFDFNLVFAPELDAGNLSAKYDVIIFVGGAIPAHPKSGTTSSRRYTPPDLDKVPTAYHNLVGRVSVDKTIPQLKRFLNNGGTILTIGSSTALGYHIDLPISNALIESTSDGKSQTLPMEKYFIPGSILRTHVNVREPLASGLSEELDVLFNRSPVFRLDPDAGLKGVRPVAWFDTAVPLRSGWAWGQHHLNGGVAVIDAHVGRGRLILFGPEIVFRAQPHGSFKLLFNGIYLNTGDTRS